MSAKPTVPEVLPMVWAYRDLKPENAVGGSLHIVLDDENVSDSDVQWCLKRAQELGDAEGAELAAVLLRMSRTQRLKLAAQFYKGPS
jgi:hypothetical protein